MFISKGYLFDIISMWKINLCWLKKINIKIVFIEGNTFCPWLPHISWPKVHEMTKDLLESSRQARKKYFDDQPSKILSVEKAAKVEARRKVIENIEIVHTEIWHTSVIENLKKSSDEIGFCAEKMAALG